MGDTYGDLEKAAKLKYSLGELKTLILPILQSMPMRGVIKIEANKLDLTQLEYDADRVADAIVEIIKQDREVRHGTAGQNTNR